MARFLRYAKASPEVRHKFRARAIASDRRQRGLLVPEPCQICGSSDRIEMHHEDYDKPLEVIWLCHEHHTAFTAIELAIAKGLKL